MAVFVGAFTLTLTNGLGDGLRDYIENQVKNIEGQNILFVRKKFPFESKDQNFSQPQEYQEVTTDNAGNLVDPNSLNISLGEMENFAGEFPEVKTVTPRYEINGEYITIDGAKKYKVELGMLSQGITQKVEAGDTIFGENQIILPLPLAKAFDPNINQLIGKYATVAYQTGAGGSLQTVQLKIVGIATAGFIANTNSFVDAKTAQRIYEDQNRQAGEFNRFHSFTWQLKTADEKKIAETKKKLDEKGFSAETFADQKKRTYDAIGFMQTGLNLFAFIALLAASFGIINTLVVAVMERTKEIGLQKALGMGRRQIFWLFAFEGGLIGFWGAVIGILAGIIFGFLANILLARAYLSSFEGYSIFVFTIPSILFVLIIVCGIALLAGVLPAFRASRLNPIEALRYE